MESNNEELLQGKIWVFHRTYMGPKVKKSSGKRKLICWSQNYEEMNKKYGYLNLFSF